MRYLLVLALILGAPVVVADEDAVVGFWAGEDSILRVRRDGDGLAMVIVALRNPVYRKDEGVGVPGEPRVDLNNPDEALRGRPILGLNLLDGYRYEDDRWQGKIYDPESGKVYSSRMKVNGDGELEMRGYIGTPLLGRTQSFTSATTCTAGIVEMLEIAAIAGVC
jgi:uncharacterized protein (DUF2147 family)